MVLVAAVAAVIVRFAFLQTPAGGLDGDEAITGIMARRMAAGHGFPLFFLGQDYGGAIEQYPQALLFLLGVPVTPLTLRIPQLAAAGLLTALTYLAGTRLLPSRWHAALAAGLFALGPYFLIWKGARSHSGYVAEQVVILVAVLAVFGIEHDAGRRRLARSALAGFCFAITYWISPSGYVVLVPLGLWFLGSVRRDLRALALAAAGGLVGLAPIGAWVLRYGRLPVPDPGYLPTTAGDRLGNLLDEVGREFVGVAWLYGEPGWPVVLGRLAVWSLLVAVGVALVVRARGVLAMARLRQEDRRPFDVLLLSVPLAAGAFVASKYAWFTTEPRYLFVMFPVLVLGLARLAPNHPRWGPAVAAVVVVLVSGTSVTMLVTRADDAPGTRDRDLPAVIEVLTAERETFVYADYWTAAPLEYLAGDRLTVGSLTAFERLPDERRAVDAAGASAWVASRGVNTDDITPMRQALEAAGVRYRERAFGDVSVFDELVPDVRPWEIGLGGPAG